MTLPIIFDCDGVLIDSERLAMQAILAELAVYGVVLDPDAAAKRFIGMTDKEIARVCAAESGLEVPEDFPERVAERVLGLFAEELEPVAGARAFLESHEGPRAVASNSGQRRLEKSLSIVGLAPFFEANRRVSHEMVARPKPAPDIYLHAASLLAVAPQDCWAVEDSVTGVTAAAGAGLRVIGFLGASGHAPDQAERLTAAGALGVVEGYGTLAAEIERLRKA
jgi:HAD superfamily hydrolase (TIGR01509 family)